MSWADEIAAESMHPMPGEGCFMFAVLCAELFVGYMYFFGGWR